MSLPFRSILSALAAIVLLAGCKKEFDSPPERTLPQDAVVTIKQLRAMWQGTPVHFSDTAGAINTVFGVVTADEQDGNLYKNVYIQDDSAAIVLRLRNSGGLYIGDSVRVYLVGCVLSSYQGMMQLDSVDVDNNVVKRATGVNVAPKDVQISDILAGTFQGFNLQGMLVRLSNVQFNDADTARTWANAATQSTGSFDLEDCNGAAVELRTSGFANYASRSLPNGKGSMVVIVSQYQSTMQIGVRRLAEVDLNGPRCDEGPTMCDPVNSLSEGFDAVTNNATITTDQVPCWGSVQTAGSRAWRGRTDGSNLCAEAAPISFDATSTEWLVTAPLTFHSGMTLSFQSAQLNWVHDGLTVWVSTDYTDNVATAVWNPVPGATIAGASDASGAWVNSGTVSLDSALPGGFSGNFVIAFKYTGSGTNSSQNTTYRVDNVTVN